MNTDVGNDTLDYLVELVITIFFMTVGVFFIIRMVNTFSDRLNDFTKVDKVQVSLKDVNEDNNPLQFNSWQSLMFAYMMDPSTSNELCWSNTGKDADYLYSVNGNLLGSDQHTINCEGTNFMLINHKANDDLKYSFVLGRDNVITKSGFFYDGNNYVIKTGCNLNGLIKAGLSRNNNTQLIHDIHDKSKKAYYLDFTDTYTKERKQSTDWYDIPATDTVLSTWVLHPITDLNVSD